MPDDLSGNGQPLQAGLRGLAEMLLTEDHETVLANVTSLAAATLPGCDAASVSLLERGRPITPVCSAERAKQLDQSQYDNREGPCLCAIERDEIVRVDSFKRDDRWPAFAKEAVEKGVLSSLSFPLHAGDEPLGALNLYSSSEDAFVGAENEGVVFARQASVTLTNAVALRRARSLAQQLAVALENRDIIGQAKGIIMAAEGRSSDEAFDVLRRASQRSNRKLHDVAREIVVRRQRPGAGSDQA